MTSLATQLKQLQIPGLQQTVGKVSHVSILFDKEVAATLDMESIYNIGTSGFQQIVSVDPIFQDYEDILFSQKSLHLQRTMESKDINNRIHKAVDEFLVFLSPYLQLQAAKKCLEWLIWRFQIHNFERDSLIRCILPYHETQIFSRIIQLVHMTNYGTIWEHLLPKLKQGGTINTTTLLKHCRSNLNLLSFIFDMAQQASHLLKKEPKSGLQVVFSFYSRTICGVISEEKLNIEVIERVMSMVEVGMNSNSSDFICSTYMVITMFVSNNRQLKSKAKASLMIRILKSMGIANYEYGLMCLLSITHLSSFTSLPESLYKEFLNLNPNRLVNCLSEMQQKYEIDSFLQLVLQLFCKHFNVQEPEIASSAIDMLFIHLELSAEMLHKPCQYLVDAFVKLNDDNESAAEELSRLIKIISKRFPTAFDGCIDTKFKEHEENPSAIEQLKILTRICLSEEKSKVIGNAELPLVVCLNHPEKQLRLMATKQLFEIFKSGVYSEDPSFFQEGVISRLQDDEPAVVKECLSHPKSLLKILSKDDVHIVLEKLSERADDTYNLSPLYMRVLQDVDQNSTADQKLFFMVLSQVFTSITSKKSNAVFEFFNNKEYNIDNHILKAIKTTLSSHGGVKVKDEAKLLQLNRTLMMNVAESYDLDSFKILWQFQSSLHSDHILKFISNLILLINTLSGKFGVNEAACFGLSRDVVASLDVDNFLENDPVPFMLEMFVDGIKRNRKFDVSLTSLCNAFFVKVLIQKISENKDEFDEVKQNIFKTIVPFATNKKSNALSNTCRELTKTFFQTCFQDTEQVRLFTVQLCINELFANQNISKVDLEISLSCLSIVGLLVESAENAAITDLEIGLQIGLLSFSNKTVREVVCDIMAKYGEVLKSNHPWSFFTNLVVENTNEIVLDDTHAKRMFGSTLKASSTRRKSEFDMFSKKDIPKKEKRKTAASEHCISCLVTWPALVSSRVLDVIQFASLPDELLQKYQSIEELQSVPTTLKFYKQLINGILKTTSSTLSKDAINFIVRCLDTENSELVSTIIEKLDGQTYENLADDSKLEILKTFYKLLKKLPPIKTAEVRSALKELPMKTEHVCQFLTQFVTCVEEIKKVDNDETTTTQENLKESIGDIEELLLAVSNQMVQERENDLVTSLFATLESCLLVPGSEFVKQLCLNFLTNLTQQDKLKLNFHCFKMEFLLDCLRSTEDPQTQENCLQLISATAVLFPTHILHSVMHVFSFMGGTLLKIDNEHTFNVIKKTIHTILPPILQVKEQSSRKRLSDSSIQEVVLDAIQAFVASCPHCPEHRREFILQELLKAIGIEDNLGNTMLLLIKLISSDSDGGSGGSAEGVGGDVDMKEVEGKNMYSRMTLDFCIHFFALYDIPTQLSTVNKMIRYLSTLSIQKANTRKKGRSGAVDALFDTHNEGEKKSRLFIYTVISFIDHVLKSLSADQQLHVIVASQNFTRTFLTLTEAFIHYADLLENSIKDFENNTMSQAFVKKLLAKTCHVMEMSFKLLPFITYMELLAGLMQKTQILLKTKAFELLAKVLKETEKLTEKEEEALIALTPIIHNDVTSLQKKRKVDPNMLQLQLFAMKLIVIRVSGNHPELFVSWLPITSALCAGANTNDMVSINAMLLCKELVGLLKLEVLPYLGDIVQPMLQKLSHSIENISSSKDTLLMVTCIMSLQKIFISVPKFMSPYINPIFTKISHIETLKKTLSKDTSTLDGVVEKFKTNLGEKVAPRILFPIVKEMVSMATNDSSNTNTLVTCLDIYRISLDQMTSSEINDVFKTDIVSLFQVLLQQSSNYEGEMSENMLETETIKTFCKLALRMTEKSLRHIYTQLFNWATKDNELVSRKMLVFYRLSVSMATTLQGLFLLFVHELLEKSADVLSFLSKGTAPKDMTLSRELLICVMDCFTSIFTYDTHGFMNRERFQMVAKPIVQQIETSLFEEDISSYKTFYGEHYQQCVVKLASAVNDPVCWKTLNIELLNRTKSDDVQVRLAVLNVIDKIYDSLGESYMVLIPETIPYLSEVLEDESAEVEEKCRFVIKKIEQITGESIQKYF